MQDDENPTPGTHSYWVQQAKLAASPAKAAPGPQTVIHYDPAKCGLAALEALAQSLDVRLVPFADAPLDTNDAYLALLEHL